VTIPAGASGDHIIGLETGGANIFFNALGASTVTPPGVEAVNNPNIDASNNIKSSLTTNIVIGQFGDDIFQMGSTLNVTPAVDTVGSTLSFTGSGLPVATGFDIGVSMAGTGHGGTSCALSGSGSSTPPTILLKSFTTTNIGSVPSSTSVSLADMPTNAGHEEGTTYCAFIQTAIGTHTAAASATFILQASASLNSSESPIGGNVLLTAHGLASGTTYNIIFAPYTTLTLAGNSLAGTFVGTLTSNSYGEGTGTLTIPSAVQTSAGFQVVSLGISYQVELQTASTGIGATPTAALAAPPSIVVGGTSGSCSNEGSTCLVLSGSPTVGKSGSNTIISASYTNTSNAPQTAYIYAVVHNALGQTVLYATSTLNGVAPGASETGQLVLFGLPSGTYTANVFVVSTSGTALSTSATVSVTI
jgi:hypothetical protein